MQKQKRKSVISLGRNALSVAVASAMLFAADASATGMGRLTVLSALGQPLKAEIELTSPNKEELGSLTPKLASPEAFKRANIEFNAALLSLQFGIEQRGNNYIIKVTSSQPMNEPFVDMLLELNSSNGKLLREYTFLLDPVDLRTGQSAQVAAKNGASQIRTAPQPVQAVPAQQAAKKQVAAANSSQPPVKAAAEHAVKPGETLSKIAGAYRSEGVSLDQMLVALYKANKDAFVGNNMNRLRAGQILQIPDAESVKATAPNAAEAHSVVIAHSNDFSAYRGKLAEQVERAPAARSAPAKQAASGKITASVKETPTPSAESPDKLKLSKAEAGNKAAAEAERIAKEKAVAEANSRVKELEKNVGELQKLLDVKNKDLAAKEAELTAKSAKKDGKEVKEAEKPVAQPAPVVASTVATASVPAPAAVQVPAVASDPAVASASASASTEKPRRRPVAPPPPPPEPSFFESLSDWAMPAGAGLIAILAGVGLWANQRRKKQQQFEDSILTGSSMKANSMFGSTGGQSVDTNNSVFNSNFAPSASQLDANEVDPVAEADVYIAYGRDTQAEEILKEALRTQPDRHAVRLKLLEIYFARKDSRQFERVASELYGMTSGTGEEWAQAASMGVSLEPTNPLYAGGESKEAPVSDAGIGMPTHPLEDLDPEALLSNSMSKDMLEAISIIDTATKPGPQVEEAVPVMSTESGPAVIDTSALDFDLGFGDDVPAVPLSPSPTEPVVKNDEPDLGVIDFDFGEPETPVAQPEPALQSKPELSVVDDNSLDFTLPELELNVAPNESIPDLSTMSFDDGMPKLDAEVSLADEHAGDEVPVLDFAIEESVQSDLTSDGPAVDAQASAFEFDLSGIDLNLDPSPVANEVADIPTADAGAESEPENAEMSTKLDLAVAYQEIGDREGARELLEEVVRGGNAEQRERANAMLLQLA